MVSMIMLFEASNKATITLKIDDKRELHIKNQYTKGNFIKFIEYFRPVFKETQLAQYKTMVKLIKSFREEKEIYEYLATEMKTLGLKRKALLTEKDYKKIIK